MNDNQFGYMFTMRAKPGKGAELRAALAKANDDSAEVRGWLIGTENDEADSLVGFELFDDSAAAARHDEDPGVREIQARVRELLADAPTRSDIRPTATNLRSSR